MQSTKVLHVVIPLQPLVQISHARREVFPSDIIDHFCRDDATCRFALWLVVGRRDTGQERRREVINDWSESLVFVQAR